MLPIWNNVSKTGEQRLVNDITDALVAYPDNYFDILASVSKLLEQRIFPQEHCHHLLQRFSQGLQHLSKREKFCTFIFEIATTESPFEYLNILDMIGLADLAEDIRLKHSGPVYRQIRRARIPHSKHIQEHFYTIKNHLDDTDPVERRQYLLGNTNALKLSFGSTENEYALTKAANKFAVNTWLMVPQCNRNTRVIRNILTDMRINSWPAGVDSILSEIVFESKMAVVSAMERSFESAKGHQHTAKQLAREYRDPLTKALIYHDSRYVNQIMARNNAVDRQYVLRDSETGLRFLGSETNGNNFCVQMERTFLLYIAEHYLRIGNDFQIDRTVPISACDFENAEKVLHTVEHSFQFRHAVEKRRDMVYCVCMARLCDAKRMRLTAIAYLHQAKNSAEAGAFFQEEVNNIEEYISTLQRAHTQYAHL